MYTYLPCGYKVWPWDAVKTKQGPLALGVGVSGEGLSEQLVLDVLCPVRPRHQGQGTALLVEGKSAMG